VAQVGAPDSPPTRFDRDQLPQPVHKVERLAHRNNENIEANAPQPQAQHPLVPAIQLAGECLSHIQRDIRDYSCTLVKQERINGTLNDKEYMAVKVRHQPFSVYMCFLAPDKIKGQEAIYVAGANDGLMLAHGVGLRKMIGMVRIDPKGALAMAGQRYPITELGFENLTKRLIDVAQKDSQYGECEVKFFKNATLNKRPCTGIQVTHPVERKQFLFNVATILVDDELNVPVHYEAKLWPAKAGGDPELLESYTYLNIKINQGFTDADFDDKNKAYNFH
jgi:hypothetical protein